MCRVCMGRVCYVLSLLWAEFVMCRVDPTPYLSINNPEPSFECFETYRRRVVSLSKTLYSPKVLVNYPGSSGSVPT